MFWQPKALHKGLPKKNNFMDEKQIINGLYKYKNEIIGLLKANNWKHFGDYFFIMAKYANGNFDEDFQKVFCRFYILNGARGLTQV